MPNKINKVFFGLLMLAFTVMPAFAQSQYSTLESHARSIASRMQPVLPLLSGSSTLFRVDQSGIILVYNHTVNAAVPSENYPMLSDWLRGQSYKSACSIPDLIKFVNLGGGLYYRFFIGNTMVNETKIMSCR